MKASSLTTRPIHRVFVTRLVQILLPFLRNPPLCLQLGTRLPSFYYPLVLLCVHVQDLILAAIVHDWGSADYGSGRSCSHWSYSQTLLLLLLLSLVGHRSLGLLDGDLLHDLRLTESHSGRCRRPSTSCNTAIRLSHIIHCRLLRGIGCEQTGRGRCQLSVRCEHHELSSTGISCLLRLHRDLDQVTIDIYYLMRLLLLLRLLRLAECLQTLRCRVHENRLSIRELNQLARGLMLCRGCLHHNLPARDGEYLHGLCLARVRSSATGRVCVQLLEVLQDDLLAAAAQLQHLNVTATAAAATRVQFRTASGRVHGERCDFRKGE